jgi:uncharacterized protein DUF4384
MVRYLLGDELSEPELSSFEERLFRDDAFVEQLEGMELDLMARYLRGQLPVRQSRLFEDRFLTSAEKREQLNFLRDFFQRQDGRQKAAVASVAETEPWWFGLLRFGLSPRSAIAVAASFLVVISITGWSIVRQRQLQQNVSSLSERNATLQQEANVLQQQVVQERRRADDAVARLALGTNGQSPTGQRSGAQLVSLSAKQMFYATRSAIRASDSASAYTPLGLRAKVYKRSGQNDVEVDGDQVFHSGDSVRFGVEVNDTGYLYIITQGSSGQWKVLFPSEDINKGDNRVQTAQRYNIPSDSYFTFVGPAGVERLFVVFSRQAERDLDGLIYSLSNGQRYDRSQPPSSLLIAAALPGVDDQFIKRMRDEVRARDLVLEKVNDQRSGQQEKAVYVVNPRGSADSRVVLDLSLNHQ